MQRFTLALPGPLDDSRVAVGVIAFRAAHVQLIACVRRNASTVAIQLRSFQTGCSCRQIHYVTRCFSGSNSRRNSVDICKDAAAQGRHIPQGRATFRLPDRKRTAHHAAVDIYLIIFGIALFRPSDRNRTAHRAAADSQLIT